MSFDVKHGAMKSITDLATLAGKAAGSHRSQAMALQIAQGIQDEAANREMAEFSMTMKMESQKQAMAFEVQKVQIAQQNAFSTREQIKQMEEMRQYQAEVKKQQQYQAAVDRIDKAEETGFVGSKEAEEMRLNTALQHQMGAQAPQTTDFKTPQGQNMSKMIRDVESDLAYQQEVINRFSAGDVGSGLEWGTGLKEGEMWYLDEITGKNRKATDQELLRLDYSKRRADQLLQQLYGVISPIPQKPGQPGEVLGTDPDGIMGF